MTPRRAPRILTPGDVRNRSLAQATSTWGIEYVASELRFLDPPESGAYAVLAVTVRNTSGAQGPTIELSIPADWLEHVQIVGTIPPVLDDRIDDDGYRHFDFAGVAAGSDAALELHIVQSGEDVRVPSVRLALRGGESLGEFRPKMTGVPPRAGPVRALSMPRVGIRTGVVDTAWEPPAFVAGQISTTAPLGEGNSVLIGHRQGREGNVFARLLGARLGDEVVASSRGIDHTYIVSEIRILRADDVTPIGPTDTARLTLMTCTGAWNPLTGEYSHRLWVVAEPPELARATLSAAATRAGHLSATSASPAEAALARTDEALARAALSVMDARRPRT